MTPRPHHSGHNFAQLRVSVGHHTPPLAVSEPLNVLKWIGKGRSSRKICLRATQAALKDVC